ncbi:hypothetical protein B0H10DRAFT_1999436 [Mycena sp. CBHHK59/15]|nr:hypothetical protein B0H10DRAFT_1999436 [Mycena sp. CBHHK59/15]
MCGPCSRYSATFSDCEYTDTGPSHGQILEEQISILQARIEELEKPKGLRSSLSLHQASTSRAGLSSPPISPTNTMGLGPLLSHFYLQQTSGSPMPPDTNNSMPTELPFIVLQALAHNFLHNVSHFGFFLDTQAFHDAVTSSDGQNLSPVLMNVMYLWGVHLSKSEQITVYEPALLAHALRSTAGSLTGTHPRTILHSLQAEVLLAYYFIRNVRFLEARYHTSAAVSIALSSGLHRIRTQSGQGPPIQSTFEALTPPKDAAEEGERISAFWNVLNLNNCWAGTDGSSSNVSYGPSGLKIDTPWPLDTRDYVERPHRLPRRNSGTIAKFLANVPDEATSQAALYAKAGILFEQATALAARYRAGGIPGNDPEFGVVDTKIDTFKAILPPVQSKYILVVHSLSNVATIQLHDPFVSQNMFSRNKTLSAARFIADLLTKVDVQNLGHIDPVLAPLWTSTCLVFIAELAQQGANHTKGLMDSFKIVVAAMQVFAPHCRLMTAQLAAVRQAYSSAQI